MIAVAEALAQANAGVTVALPAQITVGSVVFATAETIAVIVMEPYITPGAETDAIQVKADGMIIIDP